MKNKQEGLADVAVTYTNLAHLYYDWLDESEEKVDKCLQNALNILNSDKINKNSYYAYVLSKCAPSFDYFGYFKIAKDFNERSKQIYERS